MVHIEVHLDWQHAALWWIETDEAMLLCVQAFWLSEKVPG
jgi:hypothetical protein